MTFAGLSLAELSLLFAGGATAIGSLYLLRMRRRELVVPFAALWQSVTRESESRKLWRKLRRLLSLLLQLLILALLCLALGDPRTDLAATPPHSVAIVIDHSASMASSANEQGRTKLDLAKSRAAAELASLGPLDRAMVVAAAADVSVIAPLGSDAPRAAVAIDTLDVGASEADLERGLTLATHALSDAERPRILLITDGALDRASIAATLACTRAATPCAVSTIAGSTTNVAITAFAVRRYPDDPQHAEALVELANPSNESVSLVLDVQADGVSVGKRSITMAANVRQTQVLERMDAARTKLVARLLPPDPSTALPGPAIDDVAYAVVPPMVPIDVLLVTDGTDLFLEAALLTLSQDVRLRATTPERFASDVREPADVTIIDVGSAALPQPWPQTNVIVFDPWRRADAGFAIAKHRDIARPFLTEQDREHPLLSGVVLKDVNIGRGTTFATEPGDLALVRSLGAPIVVLREREHATLAFGFDPRQSDLPLRTAFPLLIANAIEALAPREPGFVASLKVARSRTIDLAKLGVDARDATHAIVTGPDQRHAVAALEHGRTRVRTWAPGFYDVRIVDGSAAGTMVTLAANQADVDASTLVDGLSSQLASSARADVAPPPSPWQGGPLWIALVLVCGGLLTLEWATFHRRVTV